MRGQVNRLGGAERMSTERSNVEAFPDGDNQKGAGRAPDVLIMHHT